MIYLLGATIAAAVLATAYFLLGGIVADWLDRECDKMRTEATAEENLAVGFWRRDLFTEWDWHAGNAEILRRNVRACKRVAGWLR